MPDQTQATILLKMAIDHNAAIMALATSVAVLGTDVNYKHLVRQIRKLEDEYVKRCRETADMFEAQNGR